SVECDLRWRSLWGSQLDCSSILLDHPTIDIVRNSLGQWNVGSFLRRPKPPTRPRSSRASLAGFSLEARDARINFTLGGTEKPFVLNAVQAQVQFDPSPRLIRFDVSGRPQRTDLSSPPPGAVELRGMWCSGGDFTATLSTQNSLLNGWVPLLTGRDAEIYGILDAGLEISGSIKQVDVQGHMHLDQLHWLESLPPDSSMPIDFSFSGSWNRVRREFFVHYLDTNFADSHVHVTGALMGAPARPRLNMVVAVQQSRLENFISLADRLTGRHATVRASGRLDGLLTIQGPWRARRYAGLLAIRPLNVEAGGASFSIPEASVRVNREGARLVPVRFHPARGVTCVAQGTLTPALPDAKRFSSRAHEPLGRAPPGSYSLSMALSNASLHGLIRLAAAMHMATFRDLDARGFGNATIQLSGQAWPFTRAQLTAQGRVDDARLLVPGLTEPLRLTNLHFQVINHRLLISPMTVHLGDTAFSGWLEHDGAEGDPWRFGATTPHLNLRESALWFTVLGHRRPLPVLDLIPGLRTLASRRFAGRALFSSVNAQGMFWTPDVSFRSLNLRHFRAAVAIAGRIGQISHASFKLGSGQGRLEARVDFRAAPARITGDFQLNGINLHRAAWRLPMQLNATRGWLSAHGNFSTRGLTSQEMSANLLGDGIAHLTDVSFGRFDPLQAVARAASLGALEAGAAGQMIPSVELRLAIRDQRITLNPARLRLSGATVNVSGDSGFDGAANLYIQTDFHGVNRRWATSDIAPQAKLRLDANLHLAGPLNNLILVRQVESARAGP
ncbi:MAG: AsmA-like C-terminal region-containing protein, partial [Terriglobia bacterium]